MWPDVSPLPIVALLSVANPVDATAEELLNVFPSCARDFEPTSLQKSCNYTVSVFSFLPTLSPAEVVAAQQEDPTLAPLFSAVLPPDDVQSAATGYFLQDWMLLRKWMAHNEIRGGELVVQIVVPTKLREVVLDVAHGPVGGHLGVRKSYDRILRHFYWPLLKKDVSKFIKTCHVCQMTGKPNQSLKPAPLFPIPAVGQPFEHLLIDCVGPLPPSKSGSRFLLTVMCKNTCYSAAFPLRKITTKAVIRALSHFIAIFGIPQIIQSDWGTNFSSKMFAKILKQLRVQQSSACHHRARGRWNAFISH
ncbi:Retrovirus-related Pol polyprotein [Labeo rohita]|uniref:Gypsy retrotransposon integrase-like protein 1 n=1 Tax=Labeo rohita TaxID=84645 RepID=A0ABQ8L895_LABRO|nr:Retrovirus-related Pol polyprotein [Labeo rohita]